VIANAAFDYLFARLWQCFGIALATSAVYLLSTILLLLALRHLIGKLGFLAPPPEVVAVLRNTLARPSQIRRLHR
jgi:Na+-driven multidrug efflux pump